MPRALLRATPRLNATLAGKRTARLASCGLIWSALVALCAVPGCATLRWLPNGMPSCTEGAIAATRRLALPVGRAIRVSIIGGDANGAVEARINEDVGGIVSAAVRYERECQPPPDHAPHRLFVIPSKCMGPTVLPAGTRLHGAATSREGRVQMRFERATLPNGRTQPFCGVVVWDVDQLPGLPVNYPSYLNDLGITDRAGLPPVIADDGRIHVQIVDALPAAARRPRRPEYLGAPEVPLTTVSVRAGRAERRAPQGER